MTDFYVAFYKNKKLHRASVLFSPSQQLEEINVECFSNGKMHQNSGA